MVSQQSELDRTVVIGNRHRHALGWTYFRSPVFTTEKDSKWLGGGSTATSIRISITQIPCLAGRGIKSRGRYEAQVVFFVSRVGWLVHTSLCGVGRLQAMRVDGLDADGAVQ